MSSKKDLQDVICISNRHLVQGDYFAQMERVIKRHPLAVIVREKDLEEMEYEQLAKKLLEIGKNYQVPVILHSFFRCAENLNCDKLHMPLSKLKEISKSPEDRQKLAKYTCLGTSVHSLEELKEAEALGVSYVVAGHIFLTDCKKGLAPRGLTFLKEICYNTSLPVYAIGGINAQNKEACIQAGAKGVCRMSSLMQSE